MVLNAGITNFKQITPKTCKTCQKRLPLPKMKNCYVCISQKKKEQNTVLKQKKKLKEMRKKEKKKFKRENNIKRLKKELDRVFSIWIRKRDANKDGKIICPCCFKMLDWQEAQNMHYNSRSKMNTRYDPDNCFAGCVGCNVMKNGNYPAFTDYLLSRFGEMWLRNLISKGNIVKQWTANELKELITKYANNNKRG